MLTRRRDDVVLIVVRFIGCTGMIYAFAVALCALLEQPVPESLTALASGAGGYLAGVLTPRPTGEPMPVTVTQPADEPVPTVEVTP